jgi:ribosomal protein S30
MIDLASARLPHADQVWSQTPSNVADVRNNVPPQVRGRRIAVQENHRLAFARVYITYLGVRRRAPPTPRFRHRSSVRLLVCNPSSLQGKADGS